MSLISEALKKADSLRYRNKKETIENKIPTNFLPKSGIYFNVSMKRSFFKKRCFIWGILSIAAIGCITYLFLKSSRFVLPLQKDRPPTQITMAVPSVQEKESKSVSTESIQVEAEANEIGSHALIPPEKEPLNLAPIVDKESLQSPGKEMLHDSTDDKDITLKDHNQHILSTPTIENDIFSVKKKKVIKETDHHLFNPNSASLSADEEKPSFIIEVKDMPDVMIAQYQTLPVNNFTTEEYNNLGVSCYQRGELKAAVNNFKKSIQQNPNNFESYVNLAIVYKKQSNFKYALIAYKKALALKPDSPEPYYNLGILYDEMGYLEDAIEAYKRFLDLATEKYAHVKQKVLERIQKIESDEHPESK